MTSLEPFNMLGRYLRTNISMGMVASYDSNPCTQETETETDRSLEFKISLVFRERVKGQPGLHQEILS